ncbi:zinc ribbon domain-containing protein [Oceanobacillus halotolerans]|uniref:zinc ribbon domain-containing protein n=1 Tax=Oceanobacillus halotolerans TaxID=2663380 RepID=UPI0013DD7C3B|nr:zinc ribbon domain-containing protein [Oceanobacillus halotolerans]
MQDNKDQQNLNTFMSKKTKLLVNIGQAAYLAYRRGEMDSEFVREHGEKIKEIDTRIYDLRQQQKQTGAASTDELTCSCGAPLTTEDVFCQECGKKVEKRQESNAQLASMIDCQHCEREIPAEANYCPVCGGKISL